MALTFLPSSFWSYEQLFTKNSFYAPLFRHFYTFLRFLLDIILSTPATLFDIFRCYYSISAICNVRKVKVSITSRSDVADINQRFRTYHFTYLSCWSYLLLNSAFNMDRSINLPVLVSEPFKNKCGVYGFPYRVQHFNKTRKGKHPSSKCHFIFAIVSCVLARSFHFHYNTK